MKGFDLKSPSLDLGCGDGSFSFIRAGGCFEVLYDAFYSVSNLEKFFDNIDVFDSFSGNSKPGVLKKPGYNIDVGFDFKKNLLNKASELNFYHDLVHGDANKRLPFENDTFNTVFSNIIYWLDEPESALNEIFRILRPNGKACLMLPDSLLRSLSFYHLLYVQEGKKEWGFLEKLDRGRFKDNIKQSRTYDEWNTMFMNCGLSVTEHNTHLSELVVKMWDIGLRPLFPVLKKMTDSLDEKTFIELKKEWVGTLHHFVEPIVVMDKKLGEDTGHAFHYFVVEKKNV